LPRHGPDPETLILRSEDGKRSPAFDKVMQILHAYGADVQGFLREAMFIDRLTSRISIIKSGPLRFLIRGQQQYLPAVEAERHV